MSHLRIYLSISIILSIIVAFTTISYTFKTTQPLPTSHKITYKLSDGLKAYIEFTGKQFLIINHNSHDWIDVVIKMKAKQIGDEIAWEIKEADDMMLTIPRIKAGRIYTFEISSLSAEARAGTLTPQAYHLRILGMTPWGRSSWDGRWE